MISDFRSVPATNNNTEDPTWQKPAIRLRHTYFVMKCQTVSLNEVWAERKAHSSSNNCYLFILLLWRYSQMYAQQWWSIGFEWLLLYIPDRRHYFTFNQCSVERVSGRKHNNKLRMSKQASDNWENTTAPFGYHVHFLCKCVPRICAIECAMVSSGSLSLSSYNSIGTMAEKNEKLMSRK